MSRRSTRLCAPALLIAACAAIFAFAATASAETRTGESTTVVSEGILTPEATLLKAGASYDTTAGSILVNVTTAAEPQAMVEGEPSKGVMAVLFATSPECLPSPESFAGALLSGGKIVAMSNKYSEPTVPTYELSLAALGGGEGEAIVGLGTKTVTGTTTTISITSPLLVEGTFNCAIILNGEEGEEAEGGEEEPTKTGEDLMAIPLKAAPEPPASPAQSAPAPAPAPAPPVLSIAKPKPLKLKAGKSKTVKLKVTNSGATATAEGSLRVKAAKGVIVKPEVQKLPALAPGASWTVSARVQLTKKAKASSTLSLTGTASGVSATSSLVVKLEQ